MRGLLRASIPVCGFWLAAGCNALFGVEEPVRIDDAIDGGSGGESARPPPGGAAGEAVGPSGGDGGASGAPTSEGGEAGVSSVPPVAHDGGAGGGIPQLPPQGGQLSNTGGTATTGGMFGAAGDPNATGGIDGAAGTAGAAGATSEPACDEGSARCVSQTRLEICDDGAIAFEDCSYGCIPNPDQCAECEAGTALCSQGGRHARLCDENGRLGPDVTCTGKTCNPEIGCDGNCEPDQVRCSPDDGDAETCNAGQWQQVEECEAQVELCVVENSKSRCIDNELWPLGPDVSLTSGRFFNRTTGVLHVFKLPRAPQDAFAIQAGLIANGTAALARIVVYEDDGTGYPGLRIAATDRVDVDGQGTKRGALGAAPLISANKDYWIGVVFGTPGSPQLFCRDGNEDAPASYAIDQSYDTPPPSQFPADSLENAQFECNLFLEVRTRTP
jgi:hypothetical protein